MIDYIAQIINQSVIDTGNCVMRLIVALVMGLCIGMERQISRHDAGLRTFSLISVGAAGAVVISIWVPQAYPDMLNGDPARIAAQVLTGIGFLGAGAIVHSKGGVQGLTTAACIWQTAIIGMTAGAGLYVGAAVMTLLTLFVLISMERIEKWLRIDGENYILCIKFRSTNPDTDALEAKLAECRVAVKMAAISTDLTEGMTKVTYRLAIGRRRSHHEIMREIETMPDVVQVSIQA